MEKETYKVAMQILEKFGKSQPAISPAVANIKDATRDSASGAKGLEEGRAFHVEDGNLRRRAGTGRQACLNTSLPVTTRNTTRASKLNTTLGTICSPTGKAGNKHAGASDHPLHQPFVGGGARAPSAPVPPLPRPILARDRGYLDKFVEYLVGDGPANRVALICRQCQSHNGMALREEFEYVAYRCCYCYYWNPARKQRPVAPRLPDAATLPQSGASSDTSDDDSGPPSRRNSLSKEAIGVESESETNLVPGNHAKLDIVEKEQEILEKKVCGEDGEEPSETTPIIESSIEEESAAEAVVQSDIIEKAPGEPEEEKVEKKPSDIMQEDDVLGADWGLVVNPAEAVLKTSDDDGVLTPEEPMEVVEAEAVSFNSEEKEGNAAMGNEQ